MENGTYKGIVKDISVYLRGENNRLSAAVQVEINGKELLFREWLELNDGTMSPERIANFRKCFPKWDGTIETLDDTQIVYGAEVQCVVENEADQKDPAKTWSRIRWMNPVGGGSAAMPEKASKATLLAKYGSKFRALAGGTPALKAPPPSKAPPIPKPTVAESTQDECWAALNDASAAGEARWFALIAQSGKDQAAMTGTDWGAVMATIKGQEFPY